MISSEITIGSLTMGGKNPVRLQSMTNTDTLDTPLSVQQCIRIIEAGADLVRLTAQGPREAENLRNIKKALREAGFETPLVADIHFNPAAAEIAAGIVEKVRINPGNYTDKRASFSSVELTEQEYGDELDRIHGRILPLINICRENATAIRIGVNHGSLSDRVMTRYGNTPKGMAVSAMEFIEIMRAENFHRLVLSMKSSDTSVMIEATRTLVRMMNDGGYYYPIHLGVTEAGEGEDGRIRSAAGIGALLAEGIGDTVRVSLSEDPELEIPVARTLVSYFTRGEAAQRPDFTEMKTPARSPEPVNSIRGPLVLANLSHHVALTPASYFEAGFTEDKESGTLVGGDGAADIVLASHCPEVIPAQVRLAVPYKIWQINRDRKNLFPVFSPETYYENSVRSETMNLVLTGPHFAEKYLAKVNAADSVLIFTFSGDKEIYAPEKLFRSLVNVNPGLCVILNPVYAEENHEELNIKSAALLGRFLTDRSVRGISVSNRGGAGTQGLTKLAFSILQATETRITRTIYLSCPTCGRTKFNLQEAVKKVKEKTSHLKGLKIAVMGCIVNGPGEMAGADWGYVGAGDGKVHIYKGLTAVLKNIPEEKAADELLRLIAEENGQPATP